MGRMRLDMLYTEYVESMKPECPFSAVQFF